MPSDARLAALFVHPVKSCRGIAVDAVDVLPTGLARDREWMVVDAAGRFATQRRLPDMALVGTALRGTSLVLDVPGGDAVEVPVDHGGALREVGVWRSRVQAIDAGDAAARLLSDFLGEPLRLVRFAPGQRRLSNRAWTGGLAAPNLFTDGYPLLVLSEASRQDLSRRVGRDLVVARFRPNLLLDGVAAYAEDAASTLEAGGIVIRLAKPCTRCVMTTLDPATAAAVDEEPLRSLQAYRHDVQLRGPVFGRNAVLARLPAAARLQVGMPVRLS
ncbi:MAG: hypothetical protein RL026_970 [Pseudomonadota bacterium]|jgi:uncharacterized protein YcbX